MNELINVENAFSEIANGNDEARKFLEVLFAWVHNLDDMIDRDHELPAEECVRAQLGLIYTLAFNPFFKEHAEKLWPTFATSALAFVESERLKHAPEVLDRIAAQVLKSQYSDIFYHVAMITGGWKHAVAMSKKYRKFHFDDEKAKVTS